MFNIFKQLFIKKYKLYYFGGKKNKNAGDIYNIDLMNYFGIKYKRCRKIEKANLICVGSNLDKLELPSKQKITIIGSGFIFPPLGKDNINRNVNVLALRGNLSKQRIENALNSSLVNCVLGDAGLLVSKIYPQEYKPIYKVGIIPHYCDKTGFDKSKIYLDENEYKLIDIQQDVKNVVQQICECECILSSSLHGLIFADSYNIPNRQIILSDRIAGGCYKFEDYYSAFGLDLPEPINLKDEVINKSIITKVINSYTKKNIEVKQKELTKVMKIVGEKYAEL